MCNFKMYHWNPFIKATAGELNIVEESLNILAANTIPFILQMYDKFQ